ncbi:MAG: hypothetical protein R3F39_24995 [Myxococcota bacterium]
MTHETCPGSWPATIVNTDSPPAPAWLAAEPEAPPLPPRWLRVGDGVRLLFWTFLRTDRLWRLTARLETQARPYAWSARFIATSVPILVVTWIVVVALMRWAGVDAARVALITHRLELYALAAAVIMPAMVFAPLLRWPLGVVAALAPIVLVVAPFGSLAPPVYEHGPQAVLPVMMTVTWGIRLGPAGALYVGALMAVGGGLLLAQADDPAFGLALACLVVLVATRVVQWCVEALAGGVWPSVFDADGVLPMPRARRRVLAELQSGGPGPVAIALCRNPLRRWQLRGALRAHLRDCPDPEATMAGWLTDPRLDAPEHLRPGATRDSRPPLRRHWRPAAGETSVPPAGIASSDAL